MLPIFIFIALPTLSLALLIAVAYRKLYLPLVVARQERAREMSPLEALKMLGLKEGADPRMINEAHKRLLLAYRRKGNMERVAAQLNQARDTLLRRGKNS